MALSTQTLQAAWETFLNDYYKDQIEEAALNYPETKALLIDYQHIDVRDPTLAEHLLEHPVASLTAAEDALRLIEVPVEPRPALHLRVKNVPKVNHITIRHLRAEHLGKFVAVEGIIKKVVEVRPKLTDATFRCKRCGAVFRMPQEEQVLTEPQACPEEQGGCGQAADFKLLTEESGFVDSQKVEIQENPEGLRGGAQPERLTVYLEDDIVGHVAPGDRVVLNGVFRAQQRRQGSLKLAEFLKVMDCNSIEIQQLDFEEVEINPEDIEEIKQIAQRDNVYEVLRASFAPEILGLEDVKDAMILSLFSGVPKEYKDGTRLRGDIHLLLVGDPGVAKCMTGDARVTLATGERAPIRDLVEEAMRGEPRRVDDGWWAPLRVPVVSMDARGHLVHKWSSRAWKRSAPETMVRLTTRSGRTIDVTPTHPLFMTDGVAIHPREAAKISPGDFIAAPRRYAEVASGGSVGSSVGHVKGPRRHAVRPADPDPAFWRLLGHMVGDGDVRDAPTKGPGVVELTTLDDEIEAHFVATAKRLGARPGRHGRPGSTARRLWSSSVELGGRLARAGVTGRAPLRKAPPTVFSAPRAAKIEFIAGLLDAEGRFHAKGRRVQLETASRQLGLDVQELLTHLGVVSVLRPCRVADRPAPTWRLVVTGEHARNLCRLVRPLPARKASAARAIASAAGRCHDNVDLVPIEGRFLKDLRVGLGLSQGACGVPRGTLVGIERGQRHPTRPTFARLGDGVLEAALEAPGTVEAGYVEAAKRVATLSAADLFWDRVESVETVPAPEAYVYDLEVPGTHNFVANGLVNHNSQLLRYLSKLAPRAVYTSGKGASSAGLTASAVRDEFSEGQWSLEAGALVLADLGVALIDELDKMDEKDSSAMHQAMEQQEISISKAGINATLKSRCAVVAAANPKLGRFDEYQPVSTQIDLPIPLLTRFDLIFPIKDRPERGRDTQLAEHILMTHRAGQVHEYRKRFPDRAYTQVQEDAMFVRLKPIIDERLMRKYIAHARRSVFPVIDEEASARIQSFYVDLRNQGESEAIPFTPRALEAIVRLTEASSRARLSERATVEDVERALRIFMIYIRGVGTDAETGVLDFDVLATGASHTQQERMRRILDIIRALVKESEYGSAAERDIVLQASASGIPEEKVRHALNALKQRGQIYSPAHDRYAAV